MSEIVELRHLRYFVAVAEELHFGKAARRLGIAQPPLSQQIRRLEESLGHLLFVRTTRGVALTPAGEVLLERARRTLLKVEEDVALVRRVGAGESGILTVGFAGSAILTQLPEALRRYRHKYPRVDLRLREMFTSDLIQALRDGMLDAAFLRDPGVDPQLELSPLLQESFIAVLPAHHRLSARRSIRVNALAREPIVMFPASAGRVAHAKIMELCLAAGFSPLIVQEAPHWQTVLRLVEAGFGVSIAPACVAHISSKGVTFRSIAGTSLTTDVVLGLRKNERAGMAQAFASVVRSVYRGCQTASPGSNQS